MSEKIQTERKSRPDKGQSRADERPGVAREYFSIGDFRGALDVKGKDPEWAYRWFAEKSANGQRILNAQLAGWDLVDLTKETSLQIGEEHVEKTDSYGSVVRKPADKEGHFLYLMRMPQWAYEKVQAEKQTGTDAKEADMFREYDDKRDDGIYGRNRIDHQLRKGSRSSGFIDD